MFGRVAVEPVLPAERVFDFWLDSITGEPVWTLPAIFDAEASALDCQPVVKRTLAQAASRFVFTVRPGHLIMKPKDFGHSFAQESSVIRPWSEASYVHRPKIQDRKSTRLNSSHGYIS